LQQESTENREAVVQELEKRIADLDQELLIYKERLLARTEMHDQAMSKVASDIKTVLEERDALSLQLAQSEEQAGRLNERLQSQDTWIETLQKQHNVYVDQLKEQISGMQQTAESYISLLEEKDLSVERLRKEHEEAMQAYKNRMEEKRKTILPYVFFLESALNKITNGAYSGALLQ
jgi:chromosome segregation ATPase